MQLISVKCFRVILIMLALSLVFGCHRESSSITTATLTGEYRYVSKDPAYQPTEHSLDRLSLKPTGDYELMLGGSTKPATKVVGRWSIWTNGGNGPRVLLDKSGYPIQVKKDGVRLLVDSDVGDWWEKE